MTYYQPLFRWNNLLISKLIMNINNKRRINYSTSLWPLVKGSNNCKKIMNKRHYQQLFLWENLLILKLILFLILTRNVKPKIMINVRNQTFERSLIIGTKRSMPTIFHYLIRLLLLIDHPKCNSCFVGYGLGQGPHSVKHPNLKRVSVSQLLQSHIWQRMEVTCIYIFLVSCSIDLVTKHQYAKSPSRHTTWSHV